MVNIKMVKKLEDDRTLRTKIQSQVTNYTIIMVRQLRHRKISDKLKYTYIKNGIKNFQKVF
ncbi:unnamed protein product [Paramecium octaurelia]|uniref:Uncharacterized protein n=1 Tax=Paramecium octaurelia TaxID=43137 RepID=A0A8S1YCS5_PAROT|nr:unnamed protein product [Paramecium octaurelia]CAD8210998.1 unnamed protein product [Paramecium octaurelia]